MTDAQEKIESLSVADVPSVIALFKDVSEQLPLDQRTFVYVPRVETLNNITNNNGVLLGVREEGSGRLKSAAIVEFPTEQDSRFGLAKKLINSFNDISILRGFAVHSDYRGKGLGAQLVSQWIMSSAQSNRATCVAEVVFGNDRSLEILKQQAFELVYMDIHPHDRERVALMAKSPMKFHDVREVFELK